MPASAWWSVLGILVGVALMVGATTARAAEEKADVVVYGGTPAGIAAAAAAGREGASVLLLEPARHVGGLHTSGLTTAEWAQNWDTFSGLLEEFFRRLGKAYGTKDARYQWESKVAERVYQDMLREAKVEVRFEKPIDRAEKRDGRLASITMTDGSVFRGRVFIDASYEGDLLARAGVSYALGREGRGQYGEDLAGIRLDPKPVSASPYDADGRLLPDVTLTLDKLGPAGAADRKVMVYNFRVIVTDRADNRLPPPRPANYDPARYQMLAGVLRENPGIKLEDLFYLPARPNGKFELNNRQDATVSLGLLGAQHDWPEAGHEKRRAIWQAYKDYTLGYLYYLAHEPTVPRAVRDRMAQFGLPKDEFEDNDHWPYYVYVREARRMVGAYVMVQRDIQAERDKSDTVALGSHWLDCHHVQRVAISKTEFKNEGRFWVDQGKRPYEIPYRSLVPKREECDNLLVPVCLSASHVAFSSVRVEETWMALGQAAGAAAAMAARRGTAVSASSSRLLRKSDPATLAKETNMRARDVLLSCLFLMSAVALVRGAEPLAVFECREIAGREWPRTLVTYVLTRDDYQPPAEARASLPDAASPGWAKLKAPLKTDAVKLVDAAGQEQPCQFWRVEKNADASVKSARLSFFAGLAAGGQYRYELVAGKPTAGAPPKVSTGGGLVTLDNGAVAIRLPGGKKEFKKPLVFPADHAAAMKSLGEMEKAGLAFGPIAGVRLADGKWVGGSYFATESVEAVRHREGYRKDPPDAAAAVAALAAAPKVVGYVTEVTEQGPLFAEARARFTFDGGRHYQLTARVLVGAPAVRIDEVMDLGGACPPDNPLYVAMVLDSGWAKDGWRPDAAFMMTTRRKTKCEPLEEALKQHGFASRYASAAVDYTQDAALVTEVVPHDPWSDRAHYVGLVDAAKLRANKAAPFVAIVPMHAGSWRAAHWVFPPKNPNLFEQLLSWRDGAVEMRWTIRAQPHSQNLLHTGEFDPDFGQTGMRRLWCLVAGPFQYHDTLHPLRVNEGYISLDNYKDWTLVWSDDTRAGAALPPGAKDREESGALRQFQAALLGDDREYPWFSHYRQSEGTAWTVRLRSLLADGSLPAARRGQLRAQVAAFACLLAEPDVNTRASGTHQGNPNMPVNRFFALPFAAAVIPDHPMAKTWMDMAAAYVRYKGGVNTAPGGAWAELISYYPASAPTLVHGALVAQETGRLDDGTRSLVTGPVDFALRLLAPPDPRFGGMRVVPGFGHEGALAFNVWTPAAALWKDRDPARAALYAWAWKQQGEPGETQHCNGFSLMTEPLGRDLAGKADPQAIRKGLASVWLPGFGAILRAHAGEPGETYFGFRQGYLASHSDANQGDFVIYAKGAPLTAMSDFGYAMRQYDEYKTIYADFGWHSRVRFGKQTDDGGWPGGGPVSGIDRHFFSDSADYLRAIGDYSPTFLRPDDPTARDLSVPEALRWTRQVLFLKGRRSGGPDTFVFRDSFRSLAKGGKENLPPTWWYQRTLGKKDLVKPSPTGFDYASPWGPKMNVHFLQPAEVKIESREASAQGPMYGWLAKGWQAAGSPVVKKEHETAATVEETLTINAAGPIAPGQDVLVAICPLAKDEAAPKVESLGEGAARITTAEGTDYVFANPDGLAFKQGDVAFEGVAGAVRVYADEVHLIVAEGTGTVSYKGCTLKAGQPATKVVPMAEVAKGGTLEAPAEKVNIAFSLDEKAGAIEEVVPGVRKQKRASGAAWEFKADRPLRFEREGVVFAGTRGGIATDGEAGTVRLVMVEGERIACQGREAKECSGPYDLTFHKDKVVAVAEGPARFLMVTQPEGIVQMPCVNVGGVRYAPGTHDRWMIVPLLGGRFEFTLENLPQPPVLRSWQEW